MWTEQYLLNQWSLLWWPWNIWLFPQKIILNELNFSKIHKYEIDKFISFYWTCICWKCNSKSCCGWNHFTSCWIGQNERQEFSNWFIFYESLIILCRCLKTRMEGWEDLIRLMEILVNGMNLEEWDIPKKLNDSTIQNISIQLFGRSWSNLCRINFGHISVNFGQSGTQVWCTNFDETIKRAIMMQQTIDQTVQMDMAVTITMKIVYFWICWCQIHFKLMKNDQSWFGSMVVLFSPDQVLAMMFLQIR